MKVRDALTRGTISIIRVPSRDYSLKVYIESLSFVQLQRPARSPYGLTRSFTLEAPVQSPLGFPEPAELIA